MKVLATKEQLIIGSRSLETIQLLWNRNLKINHESNIKINVVTDIQWWIKSGQEKLAGSLDDKDGNLNCYTN